MKQAYVAFAVGYIFTLGLGISGMTQPQKVMGFLDFSNWDPALLFVMLGAIGIHAVAYPLIRRRPLPLLDKQWHVPASKKITLKLIFGAALFGIGWGLGGYCPGPAVASLFSGDLRVGLFVGMMLVGMFVYDQIEKWFITHKKTL